MSATDAQSEVQRGHDVDYWREVARRVLDQRKSRFSDVAPDWTPSGSARVRFDGRRLLVGYAVAGTGMAPVLVRQVTDYARSRDAFVVWLVTAASAGEEDLPDALLTAGYRLDERLILLARHGAIDAPPALDVRIEMVANFDGMRAYEHGSRRSFYNDTTPDDRMVASRAADRWRQQQQGWYHYYIALYQGRIVGGCYVTLWEDVPTIMGVYTIPERRGLGIASTMLSRVSAEIVRSGRDPYCLFVKHDNPARQLYERLGFVELTTDETYISPYGPRL